MGPRQMDGGWGSTLTQVPHHSVADSTRGGGLNYLKQKGGGLRKGCRRVSELVRTNLEDERTIRRWGGGGGGGGGKFFLVVFFVGIQRD